MMPVPRKEEHSERERLDMVTNNMASRLRAIVDQLRSVETLSKDECETIAARMLAEILRLDRLGADPNNPVPWL